MTPQPITIWFASRQHALAGQDLAACRAKIEPWLAADEPWQPWRDVILLERTPKLLSKPPRRPSMSRADQASYPPRGMRVDRAANYTGMSRTTFLELVREGVMPKPMRIGGMVIWDRQALDAALDHLSEQAERRKDGSQRANTVDTILGLNNK